MKNVSNKQGFALVTVLVLLIGLSLAGAGFTFKLVYEARLVDNWQQREVANTTSETGIESAKRWLESELDKGSVLSEGNVLKANDGSPNYCLKGFKEDEIKSLKTETALLSTELGDENFKNYSYEYYIEDITSKYVSSESAENVFSPLFYNDLNANFIFIIDKVTGKAAPEPYPRYVYDKEQAGFRIAGEGKETDNIFIDGDYIYIIDTHGNNIFIYNKNTGDSAPEPFPRSNQDNSLAGYSISTGHMYGEIHISGDNLYYKSGFGIRVKNKITGIDVSNSNLYEGRMIDLRDEDTEHNTPFFIEGKYVYFPDREGKSIFIRDINTGQPAPAPYPRYANGRNDSLAGYDISEAPSRSFFQIFVSGDYLYYPDSNGNFIHVVNKINGQPFKKFRMHGGGTRSSIFIDDKYIYHTDWQGNFVYILNKLNGEPAPSPYPKLPHDNSLSGYRLPQGGINSDLFIPNTSNNSDKNTINYFRIRSCGFGLNKSVSRIESIYSYSSDTKNLKQVSWKELF